MKKILLILLMIPLVVEAQFIKKQDIPTYSCFLIAGAAYGRAEAITWHSPYSRDTYSNPYESDHKYPLNLNEYHVMRLIEYSSFTAATILSVNDFKKPKLLPIVKKVVLCSGFFWIGQQATYHL